MWCSVSLVAFQSFHILQYLQPVWPLVTNWALSRCRDLENCNLISRISLADLAEDLHKPLRVTSVSTGAELDCRSILYPKCLPKKNRREWLWGIISSGTLTKQITRYNKKIKQSQVMSSHHPNTSQISSHSGSHPPRCAAVASGIPQGRFLACSNSRDGIGSPGYLGLSSSSHTPHMRTTRASLLWNGLDQCERCLPVGRYPEPTSSLRRSLFQPPWLHRWKPVWVVLVPSSFERPSRWHYLANAAVPRNIGREKNGLELPQLWC